MAPVDPAFIPDDEHRPKLAIPEAEGIPVIDLFHVSSLDHITEDNVTDEIRSLATEIGRACEKFGFFQVINHGVPQEKVDNVQLRSREFFALPLEEKRKVKREEGFPMGYYDTEVTKNVRDWKEVFDFHAKDPTIMPVVPNATETKEVKNRWPQRPTEFREAAEGYSDELVRLGFKLLELIALSLGLPASTFNGYFEDPTTLVRINLYPPCPSPHLALGAGRHKDPGGITILAQDRVAGLEVKRKSDGEWLRVRPVPGAFTINVGDIMEVWTNERYDSVEHRVATNSEQERLSIVFFLNPAHSTWVKPLEKLVDEKNPAKYKAYNWGSFFETRLRGNFKKLNVENIQTSQFKIDN